ncbi:MAG: IscS subfamily cysteine desulfurase [Acidobacteria bacterium]|nr:IscS subfamily cysteine desulfurase [Acidobacteriota bacterium]
MKLPIYMDCHASTPVDPRVLEAMLPYFTERFGNAASRTHRFGWEAEEAAEGARKKVASLLGASSREIVFTSGATESDNLAIKGIAEAYRDRGRHIITVCTEHAAVLDPCRRLEAQGWRVTFLSVHPDGLVDLDRLRSAMGHDTVLVSVMAANNEVGVLQPLAQIGTITRERGALFHTDAAQAIGRIPFDVNALNIDLASLSAHKLYGPKGVGALYVRRKNPKVSLAAIIDGGGHERGLRSGTPNVPGIVGLGCAAEICGAEMADESRRLQALRDRLLHGLTRNLAGIDVNGSMTDRLPNNLNVSFAGVEGESLLMGIGDVALSSGSACASATAKPSHVLKAIGREDDLAHASIRFGLGRFNTEEEVDYVVEKVTAVVRRLRDMSPV